jgi:CRISPR system Cascade subunit CasE
MNQDHAPLRMIQLQPDLRALIGFLEGRGMNIRYDEDLGYGLHVWLTALFGEMAPKPYRLLEPKGGGVARLLGYVRHDASSLAEHASCFAEPLAYGAARFDLANLRVCLKPFPERWPVGRRFGFEVLACPVVRKSRSGIEKDLFLARADRTSRDAGLEREAVYLDWLRDQFGGACTLESGELAGFRLIRQMRRRQATDDGRIPARLHRPQALLRGVLTVGDGDKFRALLARGIGRHRAFGYGMLLLRPAP